MYQYSGASGIFPPERKVVQSLIRAAIERNKGHIWQNPSSSTRVLPGSLHLHSPEVHIYHCAMRTSSVNHAKKRYRLLVVALMSGNEVLVLKINCSNHEHFHLAILPLHHYQEAICTKSCDTSRYAEYYE